MATAFAKSVLTARNNHDTETLSSLFSPLDVDDNLYHAVVAEGKDVRPAIRRVWGVKGREANNEVEFIATFLDYVRDGGWVAEEGLLIKLSAKKLELCLMNARKVLAQEDWVVPCIRAITPALVTLAMLADELTQDHEASASGTCVQAFINLIQQCRGSPPSVHLASGKLREIFADPLLNGYSGPKQQLVLHLANQWFRICFRVQTPTRARDILLTTRDARSRLDEYPKADQVIYLYYTGLVSAFLGDLNGASQTLGKALDKCTRDSYVNCRRILAQLTAIRLPMGIFPRPELLEEFGLQQHFGGIIEALKHGHYLQVLQELNKWRGWFLSQGIYLMLQEKLEIVCWRNLMKRVFWLNGHPSQQRPPALKLQLYMNAVQTFIDPDVDLDDVESMCASLIDQGYIKAYIHHAGAQMVFQKAAPYGFPKLATAVHKKQPPQYL